MISTAFVLLYKLYYMLLRLLVFMLRVSEGKFDQVEYSEDN